tara:strand:+ start:448 stop:1065 length:618 start_codon:yes stop_codon:yes gene_type:complete
MQEITDTVEAQLTSANQKTPGADVVETWVIDLQHRLGALSTDRLDLAFTAAREECAERRARGQFGQLSLDDVIRQYRKTKARAVDVPVDPHCPHACDKGHAMMTDKEGYDVQVPCSCRAGEHLRTHLKIYERRRNVEELLRFGWKVKSRSKRRLSEDEVQWLMARSFETSIAHAMWEHRKDRKMPITDENKDRAALILSRSIGRG